MVSTIFRTLRSTTCLFLPPSRSSTVSHQAGGHRGCSLFEPSSSPSFSQRLRRFLQTTRRRLQSVEKREVARPFFSFHELARQKETWALFVGLTDEKETESKWDQRNGTDCHRLPSRCLFLSMKSWIIHPFCKEGCGSQIVIFWVVPKRNIYVCKM